LPCRETGNLPGDTGVVLASSNDLRVSTARLRMFPLNAVLFPGAVLNLHVFEPRYRQLVAECLSAKEPFGVVLIREGDEAGDPNVQPHGVGTTAEIADVTPLPSGRYYISSTGGRRFRIRDIVGREPYLLCDVEFLDEGPSDPMEIDRLQAEIAVEFREYRSLIDEFSGSATDIDIPADPVRASYAIGEALQVADGLKQQLLELASAQERLDAELGFLRRLLPQLRSLLERKKKREAPESSAAPGGGFRTHQEKFFGKHFSDN
jgi:Lon protease-like protein